MENDIKVRVSDGMSPPEGQRLNDINQSHLLGYVGYCCCTTHIPDRHGTKHKSVCPISHDYSIQIIIYEVVHQRHIKYDAIFQF